MEAARVQAAGTFESPLPAGETRCPRCAEEKLQTVGYGLLGFVLIGLLNAKDKAEADRRTEVCCEWCGWKGSSWT